MLIEVVEACNCITLLLQLTILIETNKKKNWEDRESGNSLYNAKIIVMIYTTNPEMASKV